MRCLVGQHELKHTCVNRPIDHIMSCFSFVYWNDLLQLTNPPSRVVRCTNRFYFVCRCGKWLIHCTRTQHQLPYSSLTSRMNETRKKILLNLREVFAEYWEDARAQREIVSLRLASALFNKHIKHVMRGETNSSVCAVPCACGCIRNVEYKLKRQCDARVSMQNVHVMTEWYVERRKNIPSNFLWSPELYTATATPWHRRLFSVQSFSSLNFVLRSHHFTLYGCRTIFSYFLFAIWHFVDVFFSINECMRHAISKCVCSNGTVGVMVVVVRCNCGSGTTSSYNIHYRRI